MSHGIFKGASYVTGISESFNKNKMNVEQLASEYAQDKLSNSVGTGTMNVKTMMKESYIAGYNKANEWISVEERKPDSDRLILILMRKFGKKESASCISVCLGYYTDGMFVDESDVTRNIEDNSDYMEVTEWKELFVKE